MFPQSQNTQRRPTWYLKLAAELGSVRVTQVVLGFIESSWTLAPWKAKRGHWWKLSLSGSRRPRIGGVLERSEALHHETSLVMRGYWWKWNPVVAEDLGFWRCQCRGMATKNCSTGGMEPAKAWKTSRVFCGRSFRRQLRPLKEPRRSWVNFKYWTLSYLHCCSLVLLWFGCDCAKVLRSWGKKVISFICWFYRIPWLRGIRF